MVKLKLYRAKNGDNTKKFHDQFEFVKLLNNPYLEIREVMPIRTVGFYVNDMSYQARSNNPNLFVPPCIDYGQSEDITPRVMVNSYRESVFSSSFLRLNLYDLYVYSGFHVTKEAFCFLAGWDINPDDIDILSHQNGLVFNLNKYWYFMQNNSGCLFVCKAGRNKQVTAVSINGAPIGVKQSNTIGILTTTSTNVTTFSLKEVRDGDLSKGKIHCQTTPLTDNRIYLHFLDSLYGLKEGKVDEKGIVDSVPFSSTVNKDGIGTLPYVDDVNDQPKAFDTKVHEFENDDNIYIVAGMQTQRKGSTSYNADTSWPSSISRELDVENLESYPYYPQTLPGLWRVGFKKFDDWDTPAGIEVDIKDWSQVDFSSVSTADSTYPNGNYCSFISFYLPNELRMRKYKFNIIECDLEYDVDRIKDPNFKQDFSYPNEWIGGQDYWNITWSNLHVRFRLADGKQSVNNTNISSPFRYSKAFTVFRQIIVRIPTTGQQGSGTAYYRISNFKINKFKIRY